MNAMSSDFVSSVNADSTGVTIELSGRTEAKNAVPDVHHI